MNKHLEQVERQHAQVVAAMEQQMHGERERHQDDVKRRDKEMQEFKAKYKQRKAKIQIMDGQIR
jgi:hypothetical protein